MPSIAQVNKLFYLQPHNIQNDLSILSAHLYEKLLKNRLQFTISSSVIKQVQLHITPLLLSYHIFN